MTHRGNLIARIAGFPCTFDGDTWTCPDPDLAAQLNEATANSPKTHFTIVDHAEHVIHKLSLRDQAQIVRWQAESFADDLPDGAID